MRPFDITKMVVLCVIYIALFSSSSCSSTHDWWTVFRRISPFNSLLDSFWMHCELTAECTSWNLTKRLGGIFTHTIKVRKLNRRAMNEKSKMKWRWNYQWVEIWLQNVARFRFTKLFVQYDFAKYQEGEREWEKKRRCTEMHFHW